MAGVTLYTAWAGDAAKRAIFAGSLESKQKTRVLAAESNAAYAASGFLVFHRENAVYAQPFDAGKPSLSRESVRVADEVAYRAGDGRSEFAVSPNGVLVYFQSGAAAPLSGVQSDTSEWQLLDRPHREGAWDSWPARGLPWIRSLSRWQAHCGSPPRYQ